MISVVACVKNRAANVKKWLASLELQTADLQVVLVDYCSTDDIKSVMDDSPIAVGYIPVEDIKTENDKFPEAYLKNVGIRHSSSKVIACTNVDVCYEPHFFEVCERQLAHNTLVMAVRKNAPEGTPVPIDAGDPQRGRRREGDGPPWSATIVWGRDTGLPLIAAADMQMLNTEDWHMLRGYDEELVGWGSLDSDLTMRCILQGMSAYIMGMNHVTYVHEWHPTNPDVHIEDALRNHPIIMSKINCGTVSRNLDHWGGSK